MVATVTVNDVLDGHVALDIECLDRIYLNGYVPSLQTGGAVVSFLTVHLGLEIPSPAILEKIGTAFRRAVASFAEDNHIPWCASTRPMARSIGCSLAWRRRRRPDGGVLPRSGWPRRSRRCSP